MFLDFSMTTAQFSLYNLITMTIKLIDVGGQDGEPVSITFYTHQFRISTIIQLGGLSSNSLNLNHSHQSDGQTELRRA